MTSARLDEEHEKSSTYEMIKRASEAAIHNPRPRRLSLTIDTEDKNTYLNCGGTPPNSRMPTPIESKQSPRSAGYFKSPRSLTPRVITPRVFVPTKPDLKDAHQTLKK